ncbi:MAG TPA: PilN domain-containing protein [Patescibacteria group bacterium]|nr:PilN domain-containing protein [bacterium]HRY56935.1 PilN domain-containing protein [Patescibacteria group bacterium]
MLNDINLIPQTEVIEQKKSKVLASSSVFSVLLLLIALGVSAYFFTTLSKVNSEIKKTDSEIESLRSKIKSMSEVEIAARNLDKRYTALKNLFTGRSKYSLLLRELEARKPSDVSIQNSDIRPGQISISGTSGSYISLKSFMDNLLNKEFLDGNAELKDLFTTLSLNSVSLDKSNNSVKFFIVLTYQDGRLQGL